MNQNIIKTRKCTTDSLNEPALVYKGLFLYEIRSTGRISEKLNRVTYTARKVDPATKQILGDLTAIGFDMWRTFTEREEVQTYMWVDKAVTMFADDLKQALETVSNRDVEPESILTDSALQSLVGSKVSKQVIHALVDVWLKSEYGI